MIRPIAPQPLTLLCFPCAGASAMSYLRWRRLSPSWLCIEPVEPPGRGTRMSESLLREYDAVVDDLTQSIQSAARGRYALFGHSMGALLAFGCARRLAQQGAPAPIALAVAAAPAPTQRPKKAERRRTDVELIADLRRFDSVPDALFDDAEMLRVTLDVLAADYAICDSFKVDRETILSTPVLIYGGARDTVAQIALSEWRLQTNAPSTFRMFDGGHFFVREQEELFVHQMARDIARLAG